MSNKTYNGLKSESRILLNVDLKYLYPNVNICDNKIYQGLQGLYDILYINICSQQRIFIKHNWKKL